jgi:two-component system response regulator AtoC
LITPAELPSSLTRTKTAASHFAPEDTLSIKKASKVLHRILIERALKETGGNKTQAAKLLEISRPILLSKIKEYAIG